MRIRVSSWFIFCLFCLSASLVGQSNPSLSWQRFESGVSASFRGISAVSDQVVWVSGSQGTVLLTKDGGKSWKRLEVPQAEGLDFRDVHAQDGKTAYLLSAGSGELSRIYKTVDGGQSWRMLFKNPHPEGFLNGLAFWDSTHGIAMGDPVKRRLFVLTTNDAGESWERTPADRLPEVKEGEYGFAASGTSLVAAGQQHAWIGTGGAAARVFRTQDRGQSWSVSETPIAAGAPSAGIFSLYFRDTQNGWAIGGDYQQPEKAGGNLART
ncbi:MAG: YCF48-related protein, partial [Acidobacteriota bacterium]